LNGEPYALKGARTVRGGEAGKEFDYALLLTPLRTGEGWLYLAVILDLYSRKVVGWSTSNRLQRDLIVEALTMGLGQRTPTPGLIHHSDRGSQYASADFQQLLKDQGIECSMQEIATTTRWRKVSLPR
jgi:transposase InsO family protein